MNHKIYMLLYLFSVFVASLSQIILKKAAQRSWPGRMAEYINPLVIGAYGLFFSTTILGVAALKWIPLSAGAALEAAGYIFVPALSRILLKEHISRRKAFGFFIILVGICIFSV